MKPLKDKIACTCSCPITNSELHSVTNTTGEGFAPNATWLLPLMTVKRFDKQRCTNVSCSHSSDWNHRYQYAAKVMGHGLQSSTLGFSSAWRPFTHTWAGRFVRSAWNLPEIPLFYVILIIIIFIMIERTIRLIVCTT